MSASASGGSTGSRSGKQVRAERHLLERAGAEILDEHVGALGEPQQRLLPARDAQIEHDRALVAGVNLPEQRLAVVEPIAQRVAVRRLDLGHFGAEIGELQREHVAGDEPRQIDDAHALERPALGWIEPDHFALHAVLFDLSCAGERTSITLRSPASPWLFAGPPAAA